MAETLVITAPDLVQRLHALADEAARRASAESALRVGYAVLDATHVSVATTPSRELSSSVASSVDATLAPLKQQLSTLQSSFDTMLRSRDVSQQKGAVAETLVLKQLQQAFPKHAFVSTAATPRSADITARLYSAAAATATTLRIEVKHYAGTVPSKELEKFKRDLAESDDTTVGGLFLSLASSVANVRGRIHVERLSFVSSSSSTTATTSTASTTSSKDGSKQKLLVVVPDAGLDGVGAIWGLLAFEAISILTEEKPPLSATNKGEDTSDIERLESVLEAARQGAAEITAIAKEIAALDATLAASLSAAQSAFETARHALSTLARNANEKAARLLDSITATPLQNGAIKRARYETSV